MPFFRTELVAPRLVGQPSLSLVSVPLEASDFIAPKTSAKTAQLSSTSNRCLSKRRRLILAIAVFSSCSRLCEAVCPSILVIPERDVAHNRPKELVRAALYVADMFQMDYALARQSNDPSDRGARYAGVHDVVGVICFQKGK